MSEPLEPSDPDDAPADDACVLCGAPIVEGQACYTGDMFFTRPESRVKRGSKHWDCAVEEQPHLGQPQPSFQDTMSKLRADIEKLERETIPSVMGALHRLRNRP